MSQLRAMLAAKALTVIPGEAYNAFRNEHQAGEGSHGPPLHFEDALPAAGAEKALVDRVVPSLLRFLTRKKESTLRPSNVLVALFFGESCFVLFADVLLDLYCELEGVDRQTLQARASSWLRDE